MPALRKPLSARGRPNSPLAPRARLSFLGRERLFILGLLAFAVAFNLYHLYPEVATSVPRLNDGVLHLLALERTKAALDAGQDPTDNWFAPVTLGYPLFHYYQHLPYLAPAVLSFLSRGTLSVSHAFSWTSYLLLSLFPLSVYWSMRRFGFSRLAAALAGLVAPLVATNGLYGLDFGSYVWRGYGLYTQLWGMLILPLALAQGYSALKEGRGYFWAVLLLAATMMSHLVYGYMALITLAAFAFLIPSARETWYRGRRLVLLLVLVVLVTSYFVLPFLLDGAFLNRSVWELKEKYDAYGLKWTLGALVKGELFDYGRFPSLTILAGIGLASCLWRWRDERYRVPVTISLLWLLLYFGRPTWGPLLDLLPMSRDLHLHRFIGGVHLGGIYLMGLGLAVPWRWALSARRAWYLLVAAVLTALLLFPVYKERRSYLEGNAQLMETSRNAYSAEEKDIAALVKTLRDAPPGRVYAGLGANWGKDYRVGAVPVYALLNSAGLDMVGYVYHALSLNADIQVLFDESRPEDYNVFNVRYVVAPADRVFPDFVKPVRSFGRHRLYEVETTGYFDLVGSDVAFVGDKGDFFPAASGWLTSDLPRAKQHPAVFLSGAPDKGQPSFPLAQAADVISQTSFPAGPPRGRVVSETVESNTYKAGVTVDRESFLVLKVTYHPNWHAYVDGVEVPTVMLMPSYVGVKLAPGPHAVRFEYRPQPWRTWLMALGALTLVGLVVVERRRGLFSGLASGRLSAVRDRLLAMKARLARAVWRRSGLLSGLGGGRLAAVRDRALATTARLAPALKRRSELLSSLASGRLNALRDRLLATMARLGPQAPYLIGLAALVATGAASFAAGARPMPDRPQGAQGPSTADAPVSVGRRGQGPSPPERKVKGGRPRSGSGRWPASASHQPPSNGGSLAS